MSSGFASSRPTVSGEGPGALLARPGIAPFLIVTIGLVVFARTVGFGPSNHDDTALITNNFAFLSDPMNALRVFTVDPFTIIAESAGGFYYRPILWISLLIDAQLGGTDLAVYHAANVVYHLIATLLVYRLMTRFDYSSAVSFFLALVFLLHPALVQATAWIPGRNDSLLAIFVVATVLSLKRFFEAGGALPFAASLLFFNATIYTKEGGLFVGALVPILMARSFLRDRRLPPASPPGPPGTIALGALWIASAGLWFFLRRSALGSFPLFASNLPENIDAFVVYLGKTLLPVGLSTVPYAPDSSLIPGVIVIVVLTGLVIYARGERRDVLVLGLVWLLGGLAPALLAPSITRGLEHRLYVPMIGVLLILAEAHKAFSHGALGKRIGRSAPGLALAVAVPIVLGGATWLRLPDYASPRAYWTSAYAASPDNIHVIAGLCRVEFTEEAWDAALPVCERATARLPRDPALAYLHGVVLQRLERWAEAERQLRAASRLPQVHSDVWLRLSEVLDAQGKRQEAGRARSRAMRRGRR